MKKSIALILISLTFLLSGVGLAKAIDSQEELNSVRNLQEAQAQSLDVIPELKEDQPKLDKAKPEMHHKRAPLKGSVQHQEILKGKATGNGLGGSGNGQFDGSARQGQLEGSAHKGAVRGRLSRNTNPDEMGLGIIGVKFIMAFGRTPIIYEVFPGTPAAEVGMRPKDIILAVDGIPTAGLNKDEVYNMIVGQPNTVVTISFRRKNDFQVRQITRMDLNKIIDPMLRRDYLKM